MKILINLIFLVLCLSAVSLPAYPQQQPVQYQLEIKYNMASQTDSLDKNSITREFMTLLVGREQSVFCAAQYLVMDSAITAELKRGNSFGPSMDFFAVNGTHNSLVIFKDPSSIITIEKPSRFIPRSEVFKYSEPKSQFNWAILEDTTSIGGIPCQKATVNFGNRTWFAWFAPSIPVSDGPYKFNGLPGLILEVYDSQRFWNFTLASISNINRTISIGFLNKKLTPLKDKEDYFAKKKYYRDNRFQLMKLNGTQFSNPVSSMRKFEEGAKKDNNWIELYK